MITQLRCTILETSLYAFPVLLLAKIDLNPNYLYSLLLVTIFCVRLAVSNWDALYLFQAFSTAMLTRILFVFSSHVSCLPEESNLNDCRLLTSIYFVLLSRGFYVYLHQSANFCQHYRNIASDNTTKISSFSHQYACCILSAFSAFSLLANACLILRPDYFLSNYLAIALPCMLKDLSIGLIALYTQPMASLYLLHLPPPVYLHTLFPSWWGLTRTIALPPLYVVCILSYPF
jgi:hypothetical protein